MDPKARAKIFAALVMKSREKTETSEVSHQSTSVPEPSKMPPPAVPEETTATSEKFVETSERKRKSRGDGSKKKKRKLFPADAQKQLLSATASEETKLAILEAETRSKELSEGKIFIDWPSNMSWLILWVGYVWGIPFAIDQELMDYYENMWYPNCGGGAGLGYGDPYAVDIALLGTDQPRHPIPQLGYHFVSESSQSQSLDVAGAERLVSSLIDFLGAEKDIGETDSISEGISQRRASIEGPSEVQPPSLGLQLLEAASTGAEQKQSEINLGDRAMPEVTPISDKTVAAKAVEPLVVSSAVSPTLVLPVSTEQLGGKIQEKEIVGTSLQIPQIEESLKAVSVGKEIVAAVEPTKEPATSGDQMISISANNLEKFIEKVLMKRLSNNWSLEAFKTMIVECVKRSHENKDSISKFDQRMTAMENSLKDMQKTMSEFGESSSAQEAIAVNLRKDLDAAVVHHNILANQVSDLHEATEKNTAESLVLLGDVQKLGAEGATKWTKHEADHGAVNARLSALEELRRLDNINRGQEIASELSSAKMEGFQMCLEVQVANGTFNRRLLNNQSFMNLVKDKDGLLAKIAEKDRQIPWRAGPSTQ